MPQAARPKARAENKETQRAQEKESKRARGAMSCAECRRLKLKCDKTVPCSSCKRRGCEQICPNGSLITGQGTRFVLADTQKLHEKIAQMSDRIRLLEDALSILQSSLTEEPHPLLHRDLLKIKSSIDLHSARDETDAPLTTVKEEEESQYIDAFGTLAIRDDGAATFYGRSAGSESLLVGEPSSQAQTPHSSPNVGTSQYQWHSQLPAAVLNFSNAFPLPSLTSSSITLEYLSQTFLPSWPKAWQLCQLYLEQAPWFFGAVTEKHLMYELLPMWYHEAKPTGSPGALPGSASAQEIQTGTGSAHDLALLFMIFCFGAMTDISLPPPPENPETEKYMQLSRAAMALEPLLDRPTSVATVQTLALMGIYQGLSGGENSIESTWALMGLASKLAQSVGLHRDCARWKLTPAEVQKRRALFWELFITDCWQSLATGRLATFSLPFVDCELPSDPDETLADDGTPQPSFPAWKARFGAECVSGVVQDTLTARAPKYSKILEIDRKIRDMPLPKYAQGNPPKNAGLSQTMSYYMPSNYRQYTLLYVHRIFFAHALSSHPTDPLKSSYGPSFLAGYRSATTLIDTLKVQFDLFPSQIARFWVLWTHAFSSSVMLSSIVTRGPTCKVAPAALITLRTAYDIFSQAATHGGRAVKFLPIIQRLLQKAHEAYMNAHNGIPPLNPNDIFAPSPPADSKDELAIFSGQTHTLAMRPSASRTTPPRDVTPPTAFEHVHPALADQFRGLDGQLSAQIQDAYHNGHDSFARTILDQQYYQPLHVQPPAPSPPQHHGMSGHQINYTQSTYQMESLSGPTQYHQTSVPQHTYDPSWSASGHHHSHVYHQHPQEVYPAAEDPVMQSEAWTAYMYQMTPAFPGSPRPES